MGEAPVPGALELRHVPAGGRAAPVFLYDLASPECYLAAERLVRVLGEPGEWRPARLEGLPGADPADGLRCAAEVEAYVEDLRRRVDAQGLQPLRWPPGWPPDTRLAMAVATYAAQIGRGVSYALAAFRQAYAAGRDLAEADTVVIAAAACEMHPAAVLRAPGLRSVTRALDAATEEAAATGVTDLPALRIGDAVFQGPDAPERAAEHRAQAVAS